jgi:hypothetical protein
MFRLVKTKESIIFNDCRTKELCFAVYQRSFYKLHLRNRIYQWYKILPLLYQFYRVINNCDQKVGILVSGNNIPDLRRDISDLGLNIPDLWRDIPELRCIISHLRSHIPKLRSHILVLWSIFRNSGGILRSCIGIFQTCEAIFRFRGGEFLIQEAYPGNNFERLHK